VGSIQQRLRWYARSVLKRFVKSSDPMTLNNPIDQLDADRVLAATFFDRPAEKVAYDLMGCGLHWINGDRSHSRIVTETEAYTGPDDLASHASKGRTKRNEAMFGPPGIFYLYFVYGIHWMLNVVTGPVGFPAAVLIRGVDGIVGPARLTKALGITGNLNGKVADKEAGVWFSEGTRPPRKQVIRSARIGVDYAGPIWSLKPYRFSLKTG
jgi:DNA-3-methyladenine glycosylase